MDWVQLVSVVGSLLILAAYVAAQFRYLDTSNLLYQVLNFAGSGILGVVAVIGNQWGFILLEGVWALVSLWSAIRIVRGRGPAQEQGGQG